MQFDLQQQTTLNSTLALPQQGAIPNQISPGTMHTSNPYNIQSNHYVPPLPMPRYHNQLHAANLSQQSWSPIQRINHNTMSSLMMPNPWTYSSAPQYSGVMSHPGQLHMSSYGGFNETNHRQSLGWLPMGMTSGVNSGDASVSGKQFNSFAVTSTLLMPVNSVMLLSLSSHSY